MRQQQLIMQALTPAHELARVGFSAERSEQGAHERHLSHHHAWMRRHLKGAQLDQTLPSMRGLPIKQLVDRELGAVGISSQIGQKMAK